MTNVQTITTQQQLSMLAGQLLEADAVALDTEFFWERSYYPRLGLVQAAVAPDACWLIDTVRIADLRPMCPVLEAAAVTKIFHAGDQDLTILVRATGARPATVFDTRIAAGFAGLDSTCSLQQLAASVLGVELPKEQTRSNWLRRPLSDAQREYAANDVRHLPALWRELPARCATAEAREWLQAEQAALSNPARYAGQEPARAYERVKGRGRLDRRQLAILRELAAWREERARQRDRPRGHIVADTALVDIARNAPTDRRALSRTAALPRRLPERAVHEILAAVDRGRQVVETACPPCSSRFDSRARRLVRGHSDQLLEYIRGRCAEHGVDPALILNRRQADDYVRALLSDRVPADPAPSDWRCHLTTGFSLAPGAASLYRVGRD